MINTCGATGHSLFVMMVQASETYSVVTDSTGALDYSDGNGHGTHCAGTIGGSTYGVAKEVKLVAAKVLSDSGSGSTSGIISAINWVMGQCPNGVSSGRRCIISMSLGGGKSNSFNSAVKSAVVNGNVVVVVAAGNDNADASLTSPASEPTAITVGSITSTGAPSSFSNFGSLVDIYAPGSSILSSYIGSNTRTATLSGTSMATPHVAGAVAVILTSFPSIPASLVVNKLFEYAKPNAVTKGDCTQASLRVPALASDCFTPVSYSLTGATNAVCGGTTPPPTPSPAPAPTPLPTTPPPTPAPDTPTPAPGPTPAPTPRQKGGGKPSPGPTPAPAPTPPSTGVCSSCIGVSDACDQFCCDTYSGQQVYSSKATSRQCWCSSCPNQLQRDLNTVVATKEVDPDLAHDLPTEVDVMQISLIVVSSVLGLLVIVLSIIILMLRKNLAALRHLVSAQQVAEKEQFSSGFVFMTGDNT